ncbi:MaoC family dehydratase [Alphaproteobacteria bacterium]|jgi:acyl dehydratase|nr:MaoC family dehydratase [Alphaproteobacteria bacterium]
MKVFEGPAELLGNEGLTLGPTDWMDVTQARINLFADATDDHQWIHVDEEKAKAGPFGAPIAHGYLTLSLAAKFLPELMTVKNMSMGVNYGVGKARFPNSVKVGARIRAHGELIHIEEVKGGYQSTCRITVEIEGEERPACTVDTISRYYP